MEATVQAVNGQPTITVTKVDMGHSDTAIDERSAQRLIPTDSLFQSNSGFYTQRFQIINEQLIISGVTQ